MKAFIVTVFLCAFLTSCTAVKDTVPVQILAASLGEEIEGFENLAEASTDYIKYCMSSDLSLYSEYIVLYTFAGTEYNEIGIFKVKNTSDTKAGAKEAERYLKFKKDNWDNRYRGDESKKIENAKVTVLCNYILYNVLEEKEASMVTKKFQSLLK